MRIVKGNDYLLRSPTFVGTDGETATATTGNPTCVVTNAAGTVLAAPTIAGVSTGVYSAQLTGAVHTAALDRLSIVWTGTAAGVAQRYEQTVDIIGSHYATLPEIRAYPDLSDNTKYPATLLSDIRDEYEELIEQVCGVAFTRSYGYDKLYGTGTSSLVLTHLRPSKLLSVTVNGTAVSTSQFDLRPSGQIIWTQGTFSESSTDGANVVVAYEHGYDTVPPKLKREMLKCIRSEALSLRAAVQNNAISQTFDGVTIRFSTPDPANGRPTGILSLDPVLVQYSKKRPGIG